MGKKVYVALVVSVVSQATLEAYLGIVLMILSTKDRNIDMKRILSKSFGCKDIKKKLKNKKQLEIDEPY